MELEGVGLSDPATAQQRRAMLDLINRLRNTGVQSDIDLPMIAVIGNQSAGKSSLIESISGITLPRSSGTCTRCPTECRLTHSETPWTCAVKLHFIADKQGAPTRARVVPFGDTISAKADVEERIRRAQRAILNPSTDPKTFLEGAQVVENETSFSRNYVSLEIRGKELADLSFVDLPGLIASVGQAGHVNDIDLVKNLVTSYIEKPSCVILLTVACETDFENQGAHHLAKHFDPEGKRTVGVLTKPDRIPHGEEESWLRLIRNEVEPLANNWYCVKQPSSQELKDGIDWAGARRHESEFFASTQPWCDLDPYYQSFLRTSKLTDRLSTILAELIAKRLPEIQDELHKVVQMTEERLRALPREPSSDPIGEVLRVLGDFQKELSERLEGTPDESGLLQTIRPHTERFKCEIRTTAPNFVPWGRKEDLLQELPAMTFLSGEEKINATDDDGIPGKNLGLKVRRAPTLIPNAIYIGDVMQRAQKARTRELPDNYPFVVQKAYIIEVLQKWKKPALNLFDVVYDILRADVEQIVDRHFAEIGRGGAKQSVLMTVHDHLDAAASRTKERIHWLLQLEGSPVTLNTHYFSEYRDKFLAYYKGVRDKNGYTSHILKTAGVQKVISSLAEIGLNTQPEDLAKLLPADPMEAAITIMASVRAYFQVAYKRFVDIIPMAIDYELIRGLERGLDQALRDGLQLTGTDAHERCAALLREPASVAMKRQEVLKKLERLREARKELRKLSI
ncbi:P-loop containing nucleoside triphosphate hydrolase protein [Scleroderma citrinum]